MVLAPWASPVLLANATLRSHITIYSLRCQLWPFLSPKMTTWWQIGLQSRFLMNDLITSICTMYKHSQIAEVKEFRGDPQQSLLFTSSIIMFMFRFIIFNCHRIWQAIFEPTCAYARWALMHRFLSVRNWTKIQTGQKLLDQNSDRPIHIDWTKITGPKFTWANTYIDWTKITGQKFK